MGTTDRFRERYGPWAVVAGAAEGLGAAFTRELARHGLHVALADVDGDAAERLAGALHAEHGVEALPVTVDLGAADAVERLLAALGPREPGLLVYNAALAYVGPFLAQSPESMLAQVDVNCRGPLRLCRALAPGMVARGRGGIVLLSSMAGISGHALVASYGATKAFNLVLAESLWTELRPHGVDVLGDKDVEASSAAAPRAAGEFGSRGADEHEGTIRTQHKMKLCDTQGRRAHRPDDRA
jgi:short-subunit dehydrogenase